MILSRGKSRVYVSGGFLRDLFVGKESDDVDILFLQEDGKSVGIVPYLETVCKNKGWPVYKKSNEKTGTDRWDFICIGDKEEKDGHQKFTGHPCGVGCEGEFTCNTLLYNIMTGSLIDQTGYGWKDAIDFILRIPFPKDQWDLWLENDRMQGMRLLRYFNFCTRGFMPESQDLRIFIVKKLFELFKQDIQNVPAEKTHISKTTEVFVKRKIIRGKDKNKILKKELEFR